MKKDEIVLFETQDKKVSLSVHLQEETVWLSQSQMIDLFGRDQSVISRHINNAFKEELDKENILCVTKECIVLMAGITTKEDNCL